MTISTLDVKHLTLTLKQLCDIECILNESFAPLRGFLEKDDYDSVCSNMRLQNGALWPMPIVLDICDEMAQAIQLHEQIILTNSDNTPIARLNVTSLWKPNKVLEAKQIFGTVDEKHPGVYYLFHKTHDWYIGGPLTLISMPHHADFEAYRHTPAQLKQQFQYNGWERIIAFQTRNPMHRAHFELTKRAANECHANLLIQPVVGMTKPHDVDYITRVKCYLEILKKYQHIGVKLSLLPLAMRMAGPKEAIWHAIIRKNYGATHFIIGRDHAGPGLNCYEPYEAQQLLMQYSDEIGITPVPYPAIVYDETTKQFITVNEIKDTSSIQDLSGTQLRQHLIEGKTIPEWFTFPEISQILAEAYPAEKKQGITFLLTGLSGAGKSTLARALQAKIEETTNRTVTLLDGDILRKHLSSELTFSEQDRNTHLERVGYVASEITKHKGIAIIAAISPYQKTRQIIRELIQTQGRFIEIYVATPLSICKKRDVKGLYKKAESGQLPNFTGISAPYEAPKKPEFMINTSTVSITEAISLILKDLL